MSTATPEHRIELTKTDRFNPDNIDYTAYHVNFIVLPADSSDQHRCPDLSVPPIVTTGSTQAQIFITPYTFNKQPLPPDFQNNRMEELVCNHVQGYRTEDQISLLSDSTDEQTEPSASSVASTAQTQ
jgi:hypothetical protein